MEEKFVQAGDVRLQYFEHGHGPETVVFVHGFSASARIWALTQPALDPDVFHSIAISNCGAGDSDRGASPDDYTIEAFAADLSNAVTALGLSNFTLVGHSLGGATVTRFALDHPQLLKALVLLNPVPLDGSQWWEGWREALATMFDRALSPSAPGATPTAFDAALQADSRRNPPERRDGSIASMGALRLRETLCELTMPVLVVGGDQDALVGVQNILAEYLALPAKTRALHIFHSVGHSPNVELPERFAGTLRRFVTGLATSSQ